MDKNILMMNYSILFDKIFPTENLHLIFTILTYYNEKNRVEIFMQVQVYFKHFWTISTTANVTVERLLKKSNFNI